jgi:hypothetical protein
MLDIVAAQLANRLRNARNLDVIEDDEIAELLPRGDKRGLDRDLGI